MKSLNDNPLISKSPEVFTPEILLWLEKEGFKVSKNDSYCDKLSYNDYEGTCYYKNCSENSGYHIGVYIFSHSIGVDIDYDCGGNMSTYLFNIGDNFEDAYDQMVDYVNGYKH